LWQLEKWPSDLVLSFSSTRSSKSVIDDGCNAVLEKCAGDEQRPLRFDKLYAARPRHTLRAR